MAEQRRAHEASEYKAHADAILKLQAQQRAHLRAQDEAHHYALNFEKNQMRAQAQAQAVANAQALALYNAHQGARAKAQAEAKQAARAQAEARRINPKTAPVVQYLLPNNVPFPTLEVRCYLYVLCIRRVCVHPDAVSVAFSWARATLSFGDLTRLRARILSLAVCLSVIALAALSMRIWMLKIGRK